MIRRGLWDRLTAAENRIKSGGARPFIFCGWGPYNPRRKEYEEYINQATDLDNDPAFVNLNWTSGWEAYRFDHTKVPTKEGSD
jgi:hypothetical protein